MKKRIHLQNFENDITLEEAFEEFQNCNFSKNLSNETLKYYDNCFKYFR